eukprot:13044765-Alexandrium_andersonii.AAC.1
MRAGLGLQQLREGLQQLVATLDRVGAQACKPRAQPPLGSASFLTARPQRNHAAALPHGGRS